MTASLASCEGVPQVGLPPIHLQFGMGDRAPSYAGLIAADEAEAALVARNIMRAGGNATDAAVALGFALSVTLPSSAGLGGSGACVVHDAVTGTTEALDFTPRPGIDEGVARYRAAIPALPRGLFALHAKYAKLPWAQDVAPAENLARFGTKVSRALAQDLAADGGVLVNDRIALTAFMTPRRQVLQAGETIKQADLATMLGRLRAHGAGDLYAEALVDEMVDAFAAAGSVITGEDLRSYVPRWVVAAGMDEGPTRLFVLPADVGGGDFLKTLAARPPRPSDKAVAAGATSFVVADTEGGAVACALSMGAPFGLGIMPPATGFLLAPAPDAPGAHPQGLAPVIAVHHADNRMVFAAAAAGADAIARTAALTHAAVVERRVGSSAREFDRRSGLVNMLACDLHEPGCLVQSDQSGAGYAVVLTPKD